MKIEFGKMTDFQQHFIVECYAALPRSKQEETMSNSVTTTGIHELKFTANGVELNPLVFIAEIERQMESMVAKKAEELLRSKVEDILEPFHNTIEDITTSIYAKLGIKKEERW